MLWTIAVSPKPGVHDSRGDAIKRGIEDLGIPGVASVSVTDVYRIKADFPRESAMIVAEELLTDRITQAYTINESAATADGGAFPVEVAYNSGVMDPVEASLVKGIRDMGLGPVHAVKTSTRYILVGDLDSERVARICEGLLVNGVVQHVMKGDEDIDVRIPRLTVRRDEIDLLDSDDEQLLSISRQRQLSLSVEEMRSIQSHYRRLGRKPTDIELETIAQTWSEHCIHKTFRGQIDFDGRRVDNLLKSTIMRVTRELNRPWCVSVFEDNAGIIEFGDGYNVCFKVETHNHPSALEPYGGAETGIGGVIRDPLGTGLGAKPIANTDVFCFGPIDLPYGQLPKGCLHPKRILKGVVSGVRDYGNRMGIPTVNGAICFDRGYTGNPLVYCGTIGLIPQGLCDKRVNPGDRILVVGGRTGRDGIHGATFSSDELTEASETVSSGAVQIGNAITEKKMMDVLLRARDLGLYRSITDCGAGGLSSAVGEMGSMGGATVDIEKVPLKYEGLSSTEIWISEAQERMVLAVPPEHVEELISLFSAEDVEATPIGVFGDSGRLVLRSDGTTVGDLDTAFLHDGLPGLARKAAWAPPCFPEPSFAPASDLTPDLLNILSSPNVCSKEWVVRQYDHEVQGGSALKPLVGVSNDGPGDASIIRPIMESKRGIAVACGICPRFGAIDPYKMAASAIDEAVRNLVVVGGDLCRTALLDNFCWGNPGKPDRLGGLVRAAEACYHIARAYGTPFISGKDSLNNEYMVEGESIPIPPTILISAISVMQDVTKAVSMDAKRPGDLLYVLGRTYREMGGSHYYMTHGYVGNVAPDVRPEEAMRTMGVLSQAISQGIVAAAHDCSEGGIGVAIAEMLFAGGFGAGLDLGSIPRDGEVVRDDDLLFSESNSRFIVEISPDRQGEFETMASGIPCGVLGRTTCEDVLEIAGCNGSVVVRAHIADLKEAWQAPLREV